MICHWLGEGEEDRYLLIYLNLPLMGQPRWVGRIPIFVMAFDPQWLSPLCWQLQRPLLWRRQKKKPVRLFSFYLRHREGSKKEWLPLSPLSLLFTFGPQSEKLKKFLLSVCFLLFTLRSARKFRLLFAHIPPCLASSFYSSLTCSWRIFNHFLHSLASWSHPAHSYLAGGTF